ncbi:MAG: flagellar hook assembly protein FlgD [Synergistaceae bacterium]|nr:flagellar hook assembly protein FlgD [Synergistaceae bacterium]
MPINNAGAVAPMSSEQLAGASRAVSNELGKDAFLRLLIAQLSNQDPLNPMDDREFIAQMAQFSTLEQMTQMTKTLEGMASMDKYSAVNYVGTKVGFTYEAPDGKMEERFGTVMAVWFDSKEGPILEVDGFGEIPLYKIDGVWLL